MFGKETSFEFDWIWLNAFNQKFDGHSILLKWKIYEQLDTNDIGRTYAKCSGFCFKTAYV